MIGARIGEAFEKPGRSVGRAPKDGLPPAHHFGRLPIAKVT
jgi:hypothetical protein